MPGQAEDRPGRDGDKDLNLAHLRGWQVAGRRGSSLQRPGFWLVGDCREAGAQAHRRKEHVVQLSSAQDSAFCCAAAGFWTT